MKKRLKAFSRTTIALLTAALVCSPFTKAYADDTVDSLEKQTNGLQNQLDSLNQDLTSLSAEITDLASKIEDTDASVQKAELDLAAAKLDEQLQYDAMKKRIKYMYETGNTSLLQIIFSSESMGDFLNKAEFVKNITEYDRNMLDELQKVHDLVAKKDADLKAEQASLAEMKTNLDQQEQELNDKISSTSGELQASSEALAKAKEAQKELENTISDAKPLLPHLRKSRKKKLLPKSRSRKKLLQAIPQAAPGTRIPVVPAAIRRLQFRILLPRPQIWFSLLQFCSVKLAVTIMTVFLPLLQSS